MDVVVLGLELQPAFRVDRRHAARSRGGDCLAVHVILDVPAGEDALDVRGRAIVGDQVAGVFHLQLSAEEIRVRAMPDGDEQPGDREVGSFRRS